MKKKDILKLILLFVSFSFMLLPEKGETKLIAAVFLLVFIISFKLAGYRERKRVVNKSNNSKGTFITCRENVSIFFLVAFIFIMNARTSINSVIQNKNIDILLNKEKEISGFIDLLIRFNFDEKVNIFINIILIILGIALLIESTMRVVIISDDKIIFYDGLIFEFSSITSLKYKDALTFKNKVIKIRQGRYEKELIIKVDDFEKVKGYLESKTSLQ